MSTQHAQYVLLFFSTGSKFHLVSNFTELHTLTQATHSYAPLFKIVSKYRYIIMLVSTVHSVINQHFLRYYKETQLPPLSFGSKSSNQKLGIMQLNLILVTNASTNDKWLIPTFNHLSCIFSYDFRLNKVSVNTKPSSRKTNLSN